MQSEIRDRPSMVMHRPPILCYITDSSRLEPPGDPAALLECIRAAFQAGIDWVQVREKQMPARLLGRLVEQAAQLPEKGAGRLLVNERLDVAMACGADGLHLPAETMPVEAARAAVPRPWLVGVSCHAAEEVERAAAQGASYALLAPIFPSPGKGPPLGLEALRAACTLAAPFFPVLALGGIDEANAAACLEAGAAGLAAIRLFQTRQVTAVVRRLRAQFQAL